MIIELKCSENAVRVYLWTLCPLCQFSKSTVLQEKREREKAAWCALSHTNVLSPKVSVSLSAFFLLICPPYCTSWPAQPIITALWGRGRADKMCGCIRSPRITCVSLRCASLDQVDSRRTTCRPSGLETQLPFGNSHWQTFEIQWLVCVECEM